MTTTTLTFELRPEPVLSDADRRRVATWLLAALPDFRLLPHAVACEAAAHLVAEALAFGLLAGREQGDVMSALLSKALTEQSAGAASVAAMEPEERATAKALGLAMQGVMSEPAATPADAVRIFLEPLQPADLAYLLGKAQEAAARIEPLYQAGRLLPNQAKQFERLRKRLAESVTA